MTYVERPRLIIATILKLSTPAFRSAISAFSGKLPLLYDTICYMSRCPVKPCLLI